MSKLIEKIILHSSKEDFVGFSEAAGKVVEEKLGEAIQEKIIGFKEFLFREKKEDEDKEEPAEEKDSDGDDSSDDKEDEDNGKDIKKEEKEVRL